MPKTLGRPPTRPELDPTHQMSDKDPWWKMKIDHQFRNLVEQPSNGEPATLTYLDENAHRIARGSRTAFNLGYSEMMLWLEYEMYAINLADLLWSEFTLEETMGLKLEPPTELLQVTAQLGDFT